MSDGFKECTQIDRRRKLTCNAADFVIVGKNLFQTFRVLGFVIFNADNMGIAITYIGNLFGFGGIPLYSKEAVYYGRSFAVLLVAALVGSTPFIRLLGEKIQAALPKATTILKPLWLILLLVLSTAYLVDGSFNPFLYFRF